MKHFIKIISVVFVALIISCNPSKKPDHRDRIFVVNSYHPGYGSSDDVMDGISETLTGKNIELQSYFMDSKRKSTEKEILQSVQNALKEIKKFTPDVLIVSDDNAVKYLVKPHFNNTKIPVVFCGVNWSAEQYDLGENVTGMLEVLPLKEMLSEVISNYPEAKKLVVLSENSLSEKNNKMLLEPLYENLGLDVEYSLTNDFDTWKTMFLKANQFADLIYMPTNGAIHNWNDEEAKNLVEDNLTIPAVTCDDFMMPYCVFGLTKVAKEQGEWAAQTALEILNGKQPFDIRYTKNTQTKAWLNLHLAKKIAFKISDDTKQNCTQL